jgi:hypothetical protein
MPTFAKLTYALVVAILLDKHDFYYFDLIFIFVEYIRLVKNYRCRVFLYCWHKDKFTEMSYASNYRNS